MKYLILVLVCLSFQLVSPRSAFAGDAVTLVFREGQVVQIDFGYAKIIDAFRKLTAQGEQHRILELTVEGGSFLLDISQIVIVCRDKCTSLTVTDPRQSPKK